MTGLMNYRDLNLVADHCIKYPESNPFLPLHYALRVIHHPETLLISLSEANRGPVKTYR